MQRSLALFFAFVGTALLAAIGYFMAVRQPWMVVLTIVICFLFFGFSFAIKARMRRRDKS